MKRERLKKNKLSSKEVLEYLSWVTDPGFLYDVALATFDLKLAVMVAETTQKDPREYLPYIDSLRAIPDEIDRRVKICLDTKRFEQAITLLAEGSAEQVARALQIIQEKKLFHQGLACFAKKPETLRTVRGLFADDLAARKDFKQAAPYYLANQATAKALECYTVRRPHPENPGLRSGLRPARGAGRQAQDRRLPADHEDGVRAAQAPRDRREDHDQDVDLRQARVRLAAARAGRGLPRTQAGLLRRVARGGPPDPARNRAASRGPAGRNLHHGLHQEAAGLLRAEGAARGRAGAQAREPVRGDLGEEGRQVRQRERDVLRVQRRQRHQRGDRREHDEQEDEEAEEPQQAQRAGELALRGGVPGREAQ